MDSQYDPNGYNRNAFWSDFARRFEERMARRAERWQARAERRAARYERWHGWSGGMGSGGMGSGGFTPQGGQDRALQAQVEAMAKTIRDLTDRVATLEKLSVDPEARLREEIEKLRREDIGKGSGS